MSTRGTAYFEIKNVQDKEAVRVGKICIRSDAYPDYFGTLVCDLLKCAYISGRDNSSVPPTGEVFNNVERLILYVMSSLPFDIYEEDEYIYRFIFCPMKTQILPIGLVKY